MKLDPARARALVAALIACLLAVGVIVELVDHDGDGRTDQVTVRKAPPRTIVVPVDTADPGRAPDAEIRVPRAAVTAAAEDLHDDLADERPANAPIEDLERARDYADQIKRTQEPLPVAGASQGFPGCRTSFVRNQSTRRGVRPQVHTLHYTVSPNRPGWSDVNAIVALFDRPSFKASSHFVIDTEGNCAYIVPLEAKAWTQAAGNPTSVSYEIIATGRERRYLEPAGAAKLRQVIREVSRRTGIPTRRGQISGGRPTRTGIVEHRNWGLPGGGHVDITPFRIGDVVEQLRTGGITTTDRTTCRKLNAYRRAGRPKGGRFETNSVRRRRALDRRGVTCTSSGPVRR